MSQIRIEVDYPNESGFFSIKISKDNGDAPKPRDVVFTSMRVFIDILINSGLAKDEKSAKAYLHHAVENPIGEKQCI